MNVENIETGKTPLVAPGEVAGHALRIIHTSLRIEEYWTLRRERGFTGWPGNFAHHVDAGPVVRDVNFPLTRITSRIPVLEDVLAPRQAADEVLADLNRNAGCDCYVYDPDRRTVDSVQSAFTSRWTLNWHPGVLALQFAMQYEHAKVHAELLRRSLLAQLACSQHPERGKRWGPESVLQEVVREIQAAGQEESRFSDKAEFDAILEHFHRGNAASLGTNETGMCIEAPFGAWTALITLYASDPLPGIGHGLGVAVRLPNFSTFDECARLAAWLNRKEAAGHFLADGTGAWGAMRKGKQSSIVHHSFLPNAVYVPGYAKRAALQAARKVGLVNRLLNPGVPEPAVWDLIAKRLGLELPIEYENGQVRFALPN